jgi:hypothetical protein
MCSAGWRAILGYIGLPQQLRHADQRQDGSKAPHLIEPVGTLKEPLPLFDKAGHSAEPVKHQVGKCDHPPVTSLAGDRGQLT